MTIFNPAAARGVVGALALALLSGLVSVPAHADITLRFAWELNGPLSELQAVIREGVALQRKINPEVTHQLWVDEIHGTQVGGASLLVGYRDLAHYAQAVTREEANAEWQEFLGRFPGDRFPTRFVGLADVVTGDLGSAAGDGAVLNLFGFDLQGPLAGLAEQIDEAIRIQAELGAPAELALMMPNLAGSSVGRAMLTVRYASLSDYARTAEMLAASEAWQAFIEAFPGETYPLAYRGLSRGVDID